MVALPDAPAVHAPIRTARRPFPADRPTTPARPRWQTRLGHLAGGRRLMGPIVIQTERLNLRAWTGKDRSAFALIAHEPEIVFWLNHGEPTPRRSDRRVHHAADRQPARARLVPLGARTARARRGRPGRHRRVLRIRLQPGPGRRTRLDASAAALGSRACDGGRPRGAEVRLRRRGIPAGLLGDPAGERGLASGRRQVRPRARRGLPGRRRADASLCGAQPAIPTARSTRSSCRTCEGRGPSVLRPGSADSTRS